MPGILFCNRAIDAADPGIEDMAPTALSLFGLRPPAWMEGKPLFADASIRPCEFLNRDRRLLLRWLSLCWLAVRRLHADDRNARAGKRMIVLGIDGMDPQFLEQALGRSAASRRDCAAKAISSDWAPPCHRKARSPGPRFITGLDPGGHGIYDFVHRDPETHVAAFLDVRDAAWP